MTAHEDSKINALFSAFESDKDLDLFAKALNDPSREVREVAHWLLKEAQSKDAEKILRDYLPYPKMQCLHQIIGQNKVEPNYFSISASSKTLINNCYSGTGMHDAYTTVSIWNLQTGELTNELHSMHEHMGTDRDGKIILTGCFNRLEALENWRSKLTYRMLFPRLADDEVYKSGQAHNEIGSLAVSPDGAIVACGEYAATRDGGIVLWDTKEERITHRVQWQPTSGVSDISALIISSDGTLLLSQDETSVTRRRDLNRLWNLQTGELIREFETSAHWVAHTIATTSEGKCLASGIRDDVVMVWDIKTDEIVFSFLECSPTAMTPDGRVLAYSNDANEIVLWDLDANQRIFSFEGGESPIKAICLSSDREWVVSYGGDEAIKIYGLPNG
jgi:WD40 repeat protein